VCGRFTLVRLDEFIRDLPWLSPPEVMPPPRYNIAPAQDIAVVPNTPEHKIEFFRWGLVPPWAKDIGIGSRMINARAESLAQKPSFGRPLEKRRCVVPADGFYEWRKEPRGPKTPLFIRLKSGRTLAMAGLWDVWQSPDGSELRSCTIITTAANELVEPIHDRMPAILPLDACARWLAPQPAAADQLLDLLKPFPAEAMECYEVGLSVNSVANDSPQCIAPAKPQTHRSAKSSDAVPGLFG
jgi:putative SOS response-associated peptidase YedK